MEQKISKEEFEELMRLDGEVTGTSIKEALAFIREKKGNEGLKKVIDLVNKLGYPIHFEDIKKTESFPAGLQALIFLAVERIFKYTDRDFEEMGRNQAKVSLIIRIFMRFLLSPDAIIRVVGRMWNIYFLFGKLEAVEYNKEKKYIIARITNWKVSTNNCNLLRGFMPMILQISLNTKVTAEETKCVFRGDEYHEFIFRW
jgi:hypothetical protein